MKVSVFKECKYYAYDTTISQVIEGISNGEVKNTVTALRRLLEENNESGYGLAKKKLPGFTVSGVFRNGRKTKNLHEYNGSIVIDVDKLPAVLLSQANQKARQSPYTYACFISPSNKGIKIIAKTVAIPETHKQIYNSLKAYYEDWLNLFIDESGSDIPRLCLYSFDPNAFLNEASQLFNPKEILQMENKKEITDPAALFEHCKRYTDKKKTYTDGNRNNYIHLLANNCNRKGLLEDQCLYYTCDTFDLNTEEIKAIISSAYKNITEHDTDLNKAESKPIADIDQIENFLSGKYNFRYNIVTQRLEYKIINEQGFRCINDYAENSIFRELLKANIKCNISKLRNILGSDFCKIYNPFIDYFNGLPQWDKETDYILQLSKTITTTQNELWEICFRKWFVAMVGSAINDDTINHTVIVFSGTQGAGKTTWIINLVPPQLKNYLYSGTINPNNKDTLIHLSECFLINLDELENLNKSEIGSLKETITKSHIRIRKAYGHNNETMPRRASFAGSVNSTQFLNDTTGSRRFLCFEVTEIAYQHSVDISKAYAQALYLFNSGFQYWFDKEEIKVINANNEQYQIKLVEEELLLVWFEKIVGTEGATYLTTTEIATKLSVYNKITISNSTINLLGKALHKHHYQKLKKNGRQVFAVRERSPEEVERLSKE